MAGLYGTYGVDMIDLMVGYPGYGAPPAPGAGSTMQLVGDVVKDAFSPKELAKDAGVFATAGPLVGTGLKIAGLGVDLYGKYQQAEAARNNFRDAMAHFKKMEARHEQDRQRENRRADRQENYFGAGYSAGLEDRFAGAYGGYRQPGGA